MSRHSLAKSKNKYSQSSGQQQLPQYFMVKEEKIGLFRDYISQNSKAFAQERKTSSKERINLINQQQELTSFRKELIKKVDQLAVSQGNGIDQRERQIELENVKEEIGELHSFIKKIQKKNNEMFKERKNIPHGGFSINDGQIQEKIQEKIEEQLKQHYQNTKAYIDRAVTELKLLVKQYAHVQPQPTSPRRTTNDLSRSISKSRISAHQKSSQRLIKGSHLRYDQQDTSFEEKNKLLSPKDHPSSANNGSSRVSYLRQKLKEFEQINKKYQDKAQKTDRKGFREGQQRRSLQKMKQFKNYLQQSESQIQQSNLDIKENQVLTESIRKWRGANKYNIE